MERKQSRSRYCIYTMRHTDQLKKVSEKGGSETFEEDKRRVKGERLFRES
jgi:hypothetical protein